MSQGKRWHDKKPKIAKAVHMLSTLPDELQTIVGSCVIQVAENEFSISEVLSSLRSIGSDKVMGLYQAQKKRRSYDNNPTMFRAMNCLYALPTSEQEDLASQILSLMDCVIRLFQVYQELHLPANKETLSDLMQAFLKGGTKEANKLIINTKVLLKDQVTVAEGTKLSGDTTQGMKLQTDQ